MPKLKIVNNGPIIFSISKRLTKVVWNALCAAEISVDLKTC